MTSGKLTYLTVLGALAAATASACGSDDSDGGTAATGAAQGLAVVNSDYKSTTVSLVDPATGMVKDSCLTSGTMAPALSMTLSGDVVLPSQPQPGNELAVIDRGNGTLTWLDPKTCTVLRQMAIAGSQPGGPHDVVGVSDKKAYVTRYGMAAGGTEGSDVLVIDPSTKTVTKRIDLTVYASKAAGDKATLPSPDRAVMAGGKVYVTLNNVTSDGKFAGSGRVVRIDPALDAVTAMIDIPGLQNCGGITSVTTSNALAVACGGAYGDGADQINAAGLAWIDLAASPPVVTVVAGKTVGRLVSFSAIAAAGAPVGFAVGLGGFEPPSGDQLLTFAFTGGGAPRKLLESTAAFTLGGIALNTAGNKLYVADATDKAPKLRILDLSNPTDIKESAVVTNPANGLPPRELAWY